MSEPKSSGDYRVSKEQLLSAAKGIDAAQVARMKVDKSSGVTIVNYWTELRARPKRVIWL